jgi:TP901-1 family phage major tail protein
MAAAKIGRELLIKKAGTVLAGVRTKSFSFAGEPVDVTTDDDTGFRTLLAESGQEAIDISVEGLTKDLVLRQAALGSGSLMLTDVTLEFPKTGTQAVSGDTISGNFFLSSLEESGTYNDAMTFSASLQSSGAWTYTPGS